MLIGKFFNNINLKDRNHYFSGLSFNSSSVKKNDIFFSIRGTNINGNKYIKDAIKNGATTIVSNLNFHGLKKKVLYIKSKDSRKLLSEIASKFYKKKPKNLVAVTGTNGKSSIADFYFQILKLNNKKVASIGTLGVKTHFNNLKINNTTLNPISLHKHLQKIKKKKIENVILEASSHGLKQFRLHGLNFKTGIFTNLSRDHLDYHKSYQDYLNSKLILFKNLMKKNSNVITDRSILQYKIIENITKRKKLKISTVGSDKSTVELINHRYVGDQQKFQIKYKNKTYSLCVNLIGKVQIKNILMAMIAAGKSDLKFERIVKKINKIKNVSGRLEKIGKLKNNSTVILDYAHTPDALKNCLQNIKDQFLNRRISIVFGCGGDRDKVKRSLMGKIANKFCHKIYLTDDNPRFENPRKIRLSIKKFVEKNKLFEISNREKAIFSAMGSLNSGELLLVAGKGHEEDQDYGGYIRKFSDKKTILKFIKKKNKYLSKNWKVNILNEQFKKRININSKINRASINSKEIRKNDVFFAIKGKKNDGNFFVRESLNKGASFAVVNRINRSTKQTKQLLVKDSLKSLTSISKKIRLSSNAKIIAITGSCGKTSLKELLVNTLCKFRKVSYSPKSYNNKYGVPLSLFNTNKNDDFGIFEVGMDKSGEIDFLSSIIKPDLAVITNISYAHAKNFKNLNQIANAKSEIIKNINKNGSIVLNADDSFFGKHQKIALYNKLNIYSFSLNKKNTYAYIKKIVKQKNKYKIIISINKMEKIFFVKSIFENNLKNILAAIAVISIFKDIDKLNKNIFYKFKTPKGRGDISKIKIKRKVIKFIDESYNANPLSVRSAIKNFDLIKKG
ncbi:MAG: UDP-N-acetylmuramoyl-L-alanyl-D-glutamate--2,6-diaminopimelate ligase, partial [Pelagibacterales bacterium]|nr:UDP-N-acetylmuramoyl-L-alanyl-D-glutamate--2,6-diaminopimelate ligase [Pelagibacterales bacterium]